MGVVLITPFHSHRKFRIDLYLVSMVITCITHSISFCFLLFDFFVLCNSFSYNRAAQITIDRRPHFHDDIGRCGLTLEVGVVSH